MLSFDALASLPLASLPNEGAEQTLTATRFASSNTFYAAQINLTLAASLFADADTFYSPEVQPGAVILTPAHFADADVFYAPQINQTLYQSGFSNTNAFFAPEVLRGPVTLLPATFSDADAFYTPEVLRGGVVLEPSHFSDADAFYNPNVVYIISPQHWTDADTFGTPVVVARNWPAGGGHAGGAGVKRSSVAALKAQLTRERHKRRRDRKAKKADRELTELIAAAWRQAMGLPEAELLFMDAAGIAFEPSQRTLSAFTDWSPVAARLDVVQDLVTALERRLQDEEDAEILLLAA